MFEKKSPIWHGFNKDLIQRLNVPEFAVAVLLDKISGSNRSIKTTLEVMSSYLHRPESDTRSKRLIKKCLERLIIEDVITMDIDPADIRNKNVVFDVEIKEYAVPSYLLMERDEIDRIIDSCNILVAYDLKVFAAVASRVNYNSNMWQITYEQLLEDIHENIVLKTVIDATNRLRDLGLISKSETIFNIEEMRRAPVSYCMGVPRKG